MRSRCLTWKPYRAVRTKSHGKKMNLRKKDFLVFADHCEILQKVAEKKMMKLVHMQSTFTNMCSESCLTEHMKERLNELIEARCRVIAE